MTRPWTIPTPSGTYRIRLAGPGESTHSRDSDVARFVWFFADCALENRVPEAIETAVALYAGLTSIRLSLRDASDATIVNELRHTLESAVKSGRLSFERVSPPNVRAPILELPRIQQQSYSPSEEPSEDDFIEIELIGEDDEPIGGVAYVVKLPDGGERSGKLDSRGFARIERIVSGNCQVSFPELDADAWHPVQ